MILLLGSKSAENDVGFKVDVSDLSEYGKVLMFDFNNDIRDNEDDLYDLFDLKLAFKEAINFPSSFNSELYAVYQHILESDHENIQSTRKEIMDHVEMNSNLIDDEIIKQFLQYPNNDFYSEVKTKTAFALRNFNF